MSDARHVQVLLQQVSIFGVAEITEKKNSKDCLQSSRRGRCLVDAVQHSPWFGVGDVINLSKIT